MLGQKQEKRQESNLWALGDQTKSIFLISRGDNIYDEIETTRSPVSREAVYGSDWFENIVDRQMTDGGTVTMGQ